MKYAFNDNGILRDVVMTPPHILFVSSYADQFIEVPDEAQNGWLWDGKVASEPPVPPEPEYVAPTKEDLLAKLEELQAQIAALGE